MAEEDIFMDYAADGSSPLNATINDDNISIHHKKFHLPKKIGNSIDELFNEKLKITSSFNLLKEQLNTSSCSSDFRLKVLELRRFNRHLSNVIFEHRKRMNELKVVVDNLNSKLLCQKFEKQHLLKEIKSCLSTKNCFETIELEEEGFENENEILDPHEKMIKRLNKELIQRQELQSRLISILHRKQEIENELEGKKRKIDDLRCHLQNLFKNSKPLIEACGYDLERIHKKKMVVDGEDNEVVLKVEATELKNNNSEDNLSIIYEKLVNFVADKSETEIDFKLRYFPANSEEEEESEFNDFSTEDDRNPNIPCSYIQVTLKLFKNETETSNAEIYFKLIKNGNGTDLLMLTLEHESLSFGFSVSNWIRSLETIEIVENSENDGLDSFSWISPLKIQSDSLNFLPDPESFVQVFTSIKFALEIRHKILILIENVIESQTEIRLELEFDRIHPNELIFSIPNLNNIKLTAKISMNSIVWGCCDESHESIISELNLVGSKYRSILDCLQAQIELLSSHYNLLKK